MLLSMISGRQCRAARAWLGLEARDLARLIGVNRDTLRRFEAGARLREENAVAIRAELERRGVQFTFSRDGAPTGIEGV